MTRLATLALALSLAAAPVLAQSAPPAGSLPLSQIVAALEATEGFSHFDEIEWDDDGYWEIEYLTTDGRKIEVRIDPVTGATRR